MEKYFNLLTLVIIIVSELIHPNTNTWVPVSLITYVICIFFIFTAIYFRKKDQKKFRKSLLMAVIVFTEYAIITAIAYLRMIDTIIEEGPFSIVSTIVVIITFSIIVFWDDVKPVLYRHKK